MKKAGFSTVELLVTLFVAAAFLLSGYQLYAMIIKDGGETRAQAKASNLAYDYLQQYKTNSTYILSSCVGSTPKTNWVITPAITGLPKATLSVVITCPYPATPSLSKVQITINYGSGKNVTQATYVTAE